MSLEKILATVLLVPMGDPREDDCVWGLNTMLWGPPGIGKSARVESAGAMLGLPVRTTYVPVCQPEDAGGTPFVNTSKGMAYLDAALGALDEWIDEEAVANKEENRSFMFGLLGLSGKGTQTLAQKVVRSLVRTSRRYGPTFARIEPMLPGFGDLMLDGSGVWFLDELSSARPAVQASFLGATLMRRAGGLQLPPGIRVIAAGNPADSAAGGWELEPPMANRFAHFDVEIPTDSQWTNWLLSKGKQELENIEDGEHKVRSNWGTHEPVVKGLIAGFRTTKAAPLYELPPEGHKNRGRSWPSPRTWAFATQAFITCRCLGHDDQFAMKIVEACVGEGAAEALATWLLHADIPHPRNVLIHGWTPDKTRLDRCVAVYTSIAHYVAEIQDQEERVKFAVLAWNRFNEAMQANLIDIVYPHAQRLVLAGLDSRAGSEVAEAAKPVLLRAGKSGVHKMMKG